MIAEGRLEPRRRDDLKAWQPGPAVSADESSVSDLLLEMRDSERT